MEICVQLSKCNFNFQSIMIPFFSLCILLLPPHGNVIRLVKVNEVQKIYIETLEIRLHIYIYIFSLSHLC